MTPEDRARISREWGVPVDQIPMRAAAAHYRIRARWRRFEALARREGRTPG